MGDLVVLADRRAKAPVIDLAAFDRLRRGHDLDGAGGERDQRPQQGDRLSARRPTLVAPEPESAA
jgi:hypothetical protein